MAFATCPVSEDPHPRSPLKQLQRKSPRRLRGHVCQSETLGEFRCVGDACDAASNRRLGDDLWLERNVFDQIHGKCFDFYSSGGADGVNRLLSLLDRVFASLTLVSRRRR